MKRFFNRQARGPRAYTSSEITVAQAALSVFDTEPEAANKMLASARLTAMDLVAMTDAGLITDRNLTDEPEPEPVQEAQPVEAAAASVTLPDGTDLTDPHLRARVESHVRRRFGENFIPLWPLGADPVDGIDPVIPVIDARPGAQTIALGPDVKPTDGHRVAQAGRDQGLGDLVDFDPYAGTATFAHLTDATRQVRDAVCRELALRDSWDIELLVGRDMVIVTRSPSLGSDEKRVERWTSLALTLLPANVGEKWVIEDDAATRRIYLRRITDRLRTVQDYDWDAPVDLHHIPFGVREDGSPLSLGLLEVNMLLGGTPGGGKSGGLTALLCGISRLENVALVGLDPKRVEQAPWKSRFTRIARDEETATEVLELLVEEMERRYVWLEERGLKKFGPAQFSSSHPLIVLVIDELADLVSVAVDKDEKAEETKRSTMIRRIIAKGRAAGFVTIPATQKPQSDVVPTALRDLIQLRVAFATTNPAMSDTILGAGMAQNGGDAHLISAQERGVCFVVSETSRIPVRARAYWVPDEDVEAIAQSTAHLRVDLPWLMESRPRDEEGLIIDEFVEPAPAQSDVTDLGGFELSLDDLEDLVDEPPTGDSPSDDFDFESDPPRDPAPSVVDDEFDELPTTPVRVVEEFDEFDAPSPAPRRVVALDDLFD